MPDHGFHYSPCRGRGSLVPVIAGIVAVAALAGGTGAAGAAAAGALLDLLIWLAVAVGVAVVLIVAAIILTAPRRRDRREALVQARAERIEQDRERAEVAHRRKVEIAAAQGAAQGHAIAAAVTAALQSQPAYPLVREPARVTVKAIGGEVVKR